MNAGKDGLVIEKAKSTVRSNGAKPNPMKKILAEAKFRKKILARRIRHERVLLRNRAEKKAIDEIIPGSVFVVTLAIRRVFSVLKSAYRWISTVYGKIDARVTKVNQRLLVWQQHVLNVSSELRLNSEGLLQRQPIRFVKRNGDIVTKEGRILALIDLSGLSQAETIRVVNELHGLGPAYPFKLIWEGRVSGAIIAEHVSWLLRQAEQNKHKYLQFSPRATLDFDTLLRWYLEVAEAIRRGHRQVRPLLVVSKRALKGDLGFLAERQLGSIEVSLYLLGLLDTLSEWDDQPFREAQEQSREKGILPTVTPDTLDFYQEVIVAEKSSIWPNREGQAAQRKTFLSSFNIYALPSVEKLRTLLLPYLAHEDRRFYISLSSQAVPLDGRTRFLKYAKKDLRTFSGVDKVRAQLPAGWSRSSKDEKTALLSTALESVAKALYVVDFENAMDIIPRLERSCFRVSPLTLVIRTTTKEDLREFHKEVKQELKNSKVWFEEPEDWPENEFNLYNVLPTLVEREVTPEILNVPAWQDLLKDSLHAQAPYVPREGIICGVLDEDGSPLAFDLTILSAQGTPSSGKTMTAKVLAAFFRLADPERRVIVFDNTVAAQRVGQDNRPVIDEAQHQGWVQWAELTGGKVIYSALYETPQELVKALEAVEDERFIVYYPERAKKQNDLAALGWVLNAMRRFSRSGEFGEFDLQQMVVFDDILPWDSDINTPDNPGMRMETLSKDVLTQCISTGSMVILTLQTARAVQLSNPSSHDVITTDVRAWLNFVTPGHGDVAGSIGMRPYTREGEALIDKTSAYMAALAPLGSGSTRDPGRCVVTFHNIDAKLARILVHPEMLPILSRKVVK